MERKSIKPFLDDTGKIVQLPQKYKMRCAVLAYLADKFQPDRNYTEGEVNALCTEWHTFGDYFLVRRELVDNGFLNRERDGSRYWRAVAKSEQTEPPSAGERPG